jgi:hypothetical protein
VAAVLRAESRDGARWRCYRRTAGTVLRSVATWRCYRQTAGKVLIYVAVLHQADSRDSTMLRGGATCGKQGRRCYLAVLHADSTDGATWRCYSAVP